MSQPKVALISTGLGHVTRGIETWTIDLGIALHEQDFPVTVYKGGGKPETSYEKVIECLQRNDAKSKFIMKFRPGFMWKWGYATGYTLEQKTFYKNIFPELVKENFDLIHTQDPQIAEYIQQDIRAGKLTTKVILAHGTEEPHKFLGQFDYLQHLAPHHQQETEAAGFKGKKWYAIGNFVDIEQFQPRAKNVLLRQEYNIPEGAFVVLSVAALKKHHKRMDYVIREVAALNNKNVYLVMAGATNEQTAEVMELGKELLGDNAIFISNFPRERIPELQAMSDVFVLGSLKEMMPIALLEAIAAGLPAIVHQYPVEEWMIGPGGDAVDLSNPGGLKVALEVYLDQKYRKYKAEAARNHAVQNFSKEVIMQQILKMYDEVLNDAS